MPESRSRAAAAHRRVNFRSRLDLRKIFFFDVITFESRLQNFSGSNPYNPPSINSVALLELLMPVLSTYFWVASHLRVFRGSSATISFNKEHDEIIINNFRQTIQSKDFLLVSVLFKNLFRISFFHSSFGILLAGNCWDYNIEHARH